METLARWAWRDLVRWLATFDSAVIIWRDSDGFPSSRRCHPVPNDDRRALTIDILPGAEMRPGDAGLLCHSHDADLWGLRAFRVNGELQQADGIWWFVPRRLIPRVGVGSARSQVRLVLSAVRHVRRNARQYLHRRGLTAPTIDWREIDAGKHEGALLLESERPDRASSGRMVPVGGQPAWSDTGEAQGALSALPDAVVRAFRAYRTCEFSTVARDGTPVTWPTVAIFQPDEGRFIVGTSIGQNRKALNVRREPRVALLFSDPTGSGQTDPPTVLVQGIAECPEELFVSGPLVRKYWQEIYRRQRPPAWMEWGMRRAGC